uniref:Uncharacterized protein n=1 Tax=viral metagenome TaxID=1070528 RepID=A0A6C0F5L4_9ZZZZ
MIRNLVNIKNTISKEGLNVLVVSYGGCCSNALADALEKNGYNCKTKSWMDILCHCPRYIDVNVPIIYVYDNPIKSLISMKNRGNGYWNINQKKLSNNNNTILSDKNLLELMINQFNSWTSIKRDNVLIIKASELFNDAIVDKLEGFLKKKVKGFPLLYKKPKTNIDNIKNENLNKLFEEYNEEIDKINNFIPFF